MSSTDRKAVSNMKNFIIGFKFFCVLAASIMIGYWVYKFHKNDDITLIEYKSIVDLDDVVLPELSICLREPFLNEPLNKIGLTKDGYENYLKGDLNSTEIYRSIEYHNVTLNIFDYFAYVRIRFKSNSNDGTVVCNDMPNCPYIKFKNNYNGFMKEAFFKCFGVEVDKSLSKDIDYFILVLDNNLRYVIGEATGSMFSFNLPNQFIRNFHGIQPFRWSNDTKLGMDVLEVSSIEMLKRRNKKQEHCMDDWISYDQVIERQHLEKVACRAPYQTLESELPLCDTKEKMKQSLFDGPVLARKYEPPCQEMPNVVYHYGIDKHEKHFEDRIVLYVSFPEIWKIITQYQGVDVHALIGNIGGYIGLFLGYAIIQAPDMLLNLHNWFARKNERKDLCCDTAVTTKKAIEKNITFLTKMQINKGIGTNVNAKGVKAKSRETNDPNRKNMHVIDPKDLKWIITKFEKIDSTLETMKEQKNQPSNKS